MASGTIMHYYVTYRVVQPEPFHCKSHGRPSGNISFQQSQIRAAEQKPLKMLFSIPSWSKFYPCPMCDAQVGGSNGNYGFPHAALCLCLSVYAWGSVQPSLYPPYDKCPLCHLHIARIQLWLFHVFAFFFFPSLVQSNWMQNPIPGPRGVSRQKSSLFI